MVPKNLKTWSPQPQNLKSGPYTVEAPGYEKVEGETIPRRNARSKDKLITTLPGVTTIYDIWRYASEKFGNAKALGSRNLVKTHTELKKVKKVIDGKEQEVDKKWTYFELSGYNYMTFTEYEKLVLSYGAGLRKLGMNKDDRLLLFAATRYCSSSRYIKTVLLISLQSTLACIGTWYSPHHIEEMIHHS